MVRVTSVMCCLALIFSAGLSHAATQVDDLKLEVEKLRKEINQRNDGKASPIGKVDRMMGDKYGPNSPVTTHAGKLQISGLLQVWYQAVQNDNVGIVKAAGGNNLDASAGAFPGTESNEVNDNDTFRIRRSQLKFTIDIHENISAVVMIDPAREHNISYYPLPTFSRHDALFGGPFFAQTGAGLQGGNTIVPQLLQDAYISYHGVIPHHDFTIGQFIPPSGEEAWRGDGYLEFVERAMCTGVNKVRDIGAMVHGSWINGRVQYWAGVFNGPGGSMLADPEILEAGNRSDDNDAKDVAWRVAFRPVWSTDPCTWYGRLELGFHRTDGVKGEAGSTNNEANWINGLNKEQTSAYRMGAWAWYRPGGPVRGAWFRGEWSQAHDRIGGSNILPPTQLLQLGSNTDAGAAAIQMNPGAVTVSGWYFATGYKMSESRFAEDLAGCSNFVGKALHDMEFAFRYEVFQNISAEDLVNPDRNTDLFKTQAYTAGINYYIKGFDAKLQANYIWVDEPSDGNPNRGLREVRNNVFVVNFQVMF